MTKASHPWRVHLGLALAALWPVLLAPHRQMVGHPDADVWNHAWGPWWFWENLRSFSLPWETQLLKGPDGGVLWFIDPYAGLIGMLPVGILGVYFAYNLVLVVYLTITSWAAARLASRIAGHGLHTLAASVSVLFGPYLLSEVHNGISEACNLAPTILALTAAHDAFQNNKRRDWLLLGLFLGLTALGSLYYLLGVSIVIGVWGCVWLIQKPQADALKNALLSALTASVLIAPLLWVMQKSVLADNAIVERGNDAAVDLLQIHNAVDPRTYFWPGGFQSVDLAAQGEAFLHSGYIGWSILILAAIGVHRLRLWRWCTAIGVLLVLGLGSRLYWGDAWVVNDQSQTYVLPYHLLEELLPPQAITHSLRVAMPALLLLGALAAAGLAKRSRRVTLGVLIAIPLEMIWIGGSPWPPERTEALDIRAAQHITKSPHEGMILDLPGAVGNTMATSQYLIYQTHTGRPIPYGPDARLSASAKELPENLFSVLALASEHRENHRDPLTQKVRELVQLDARALQQRNIQWIVVHRDLERGNEHIALTESILEAMLGKPEVIGSKAIYKNAPLSEVPLSEAWKKELISNP